MSKLNVKESATGRRWKVADADEKEALAIKNKTGLPLPLAEILVSRGLTKDNVDDYITPKIKNLMPDPYKMKDMQKAVERICEAIEGGKKIVGFCDFDTDGGTSGGLITRYFREIQANLVEVYVPHRESEGYGPNVHAFRSLVAKHNNLDLIMTMDCGSGEDAQEAIRVAQKKGVDVLIFDHHKTQKDCPAFTEVNPRREDDTSGLSYLSACGVTYMAMIAINRELDKRGWFKKQGIKKPDMMDYIDVVAFGTIGDVVPLVGLNRALTVQGLRRMNDRNNRHPAIALLLSFVKDAADREVTSETVAYGLVPRTNANNRVGDTANLIVRLFGAEFEKTGKHSPNIPSKEMIDIAQKFEQYNTIRKQKQEEALKSINLEEKLKQDKYFSLLKGKNWLLGIIGVVAGQVKEELDRVVAALGYNSRTGLWEASARSMPDVDLGDLVEAAKKKGLIEKGGGHPMAAGFHIKEENLEKFEQFIEEKISEQMKGETLKQEVDVSAVLSVAGINLDLADRMRVFEPSGQKNEKPLFALQSVIVHEIKFVGANNDTIQVVLKDKEGGDAWVKGVAFRQREGSALRDMLEKAARSRSPIHLVGDINVNDFRGKKTPQVFIKDAVFVEGFEPKLKKKRSRKRKERKRSPSMTRNLKL